LWAITLTPGGGWIALASDCGTGSPDVLPRRGTRLTAQLEVADG